MTQPKTEMKIKLVEALLRPLTPDEVAFINMIAEWDQNTRNQFNELMSAMYKAGQADQQSYHEAHERGDARL